MKKALEFLKECGTFFFATAEGDQPRVRPFGAVFEFEEKLYFVTNNTKNCYIQMLANPKVEICGMNKEMKWIRIAGEVASDDRREVKELALATFPNLKSMYNVDDGIFETLYFTVGTATLYAFGAQPESFLL